MPRAAVWTKDVLSLLGTLAGLNTFLREVPCIFHFLSEVERCGDLCVLSK